MTDTTDKLALAALLFGLIAAVRQRYPKLDGVVIWLLAFVAGVGLSFLVGDLARGLRPIILEGLLMGGGAIGIGGGIGYAASKMGGTVTALGPVLTQTAPDTTTTTATVTTTEKKPSGAPGAP